MSVSVHLTRQFVTDADLYASYQHCSVAAFGALAAVQPSVDTFHLSLVTYWMGYVLFSAGSTKRTAPYILPPTNQQTHYIRYALGTVPHSVKSAAS